MAVSSPILILKLHDKGIKLKKGCLRTKQPGLFLPRLSDWTHIHQYRAHGNATQIGACPLVIRVACDQRQN